MTQKIKSKNSEEQSFTSKRSARLTAAQLIYEHAIIGTPLLTLLEDFRLNRSTEPMDEIEEDLGDVALCAPDFVLLKEIIQGYKDRYSDVEGILYAQTQNRSRQPEPLLKAILQTAIAELLVTQVDHPIVINDYIDVTKAFYDGQESKLVNGMLDKVSKILRS